MDKTFLPLFDQTPPEAIPKTLIQIREDLGECYRCGLCKARRNIVFGQGNPQARIMFVGEGPGEEEDNTGLAFVGKSGRLLTEILLEVGLNREEIYITNIVKCRPPNNREPERDEIKACGQFLTQQIVSIHPKVVVALGRPAANFLTNIPASVSKMRGHLWEYKVNGFPTDILIMATYHPAYILRNRQDRKALVEDLHLAVKTARQK